MESVKCDCGQKVLWFLRIRAIPDRAAATLDLIRSKVGTESWQLMAPLARL